MNSFVSVIIPTYKRPIFLKETIESVLSQTYKNIEIIIVDDNDPSDKDRKETEKLIKQYKDNNIVYIKHEKNMGAPAARNTGLKSAKGEFVAFLDDDDLWLPQKIEKQIKKFSSFTDDYGIVYCGYDYIINNKVIPKRNRYNIEGDFKRESLQYCPFGSPTPLIRKKYLNMIGGFDERFSSLEDWDLWIRLAQVCKCSFIPEVLALYRVHGSQISTDINKTIKGREMILKKHITKIKEYPEALYWHYRRLGSLYSYANDTNKAYEYFIKALKTIHFSKDIYIHLLLLLMPYYLRKKIIEYFGMKKIENILIIN